MNIVSKLEDWKKIRNEFSTASVGFVPTMGFLHHGHLSLCEKSKNENEITVVSIFVNPSQFNQQADFKLYPRDIERDIKLIENKVDYLFIPDADEIYLDKYQFQIVETQLTKELEGEHRPGHFTGVLTAVLKLLNLIKPSKAYFGEKDFQQLLLIKKMVTAFYMSVDVVGCETIRDHDQLALSSRNSRLTLEQRKIAAHFPRLLHSNESVDSITSKLKALNFKVDYIVEKWQRRLGAVWLDDVRLIDNVIMKV